MKQVFRHIDNWLKILVFEAQAFTGFMANVGRGLYKKPRYWNDLFDYMDIMGVGSVPIVMIAGGCIGALITLETLSELQTFGANVLLGKLTGISIVRGIGPVFTAMIVSTRVSPSAAAELGSMQVTQQIDALMTMGTNPYHKLITPRIFAALFMFPALAVVNGVAAISAGSLVAKFSGGMSALFFLKQSLTNITIGDILWGLMKSTVFGFVVLSIACYLGLRVSGGTASVRSAASQAAVAGVLLILLSDFVMTTVGRSL